MEKHVTKQTQSSLDLILSRQIEMTSKVDGIQLLFNLELKQVCELKKISKDQEFAIREEIKKTKMKEAQADREGILQDQIEALTQKEIQSITKDYQLQKKLADMKNIKDCLQIIRDFKLRIEELNKIMKQKKIFQKLKKNEKILLEKVKELTEIIQINNIQSETVKLTQHLNQKQSLQSSEKNPNKKQTENNMQVDIQTKLDILNEELKPYSNQFHTINHNYINISDKCYTIPNNKYYTKSYTLFEYCILLQKYKYIREYCQYKLQSQNTYTTNKYFEYCKNGNIAAVYYCIVVKNVDAEKVNKNDGNKNGFIYLCENRRIEILKMMIEIFQISSEQKYDYEYEYKDGKRYEIKECTGFIIACRNNSLEVVQLLIDKYSSITEQKSNNGGTGFFQACVNNSLEVVQLLIDKYSSITEQKNNGGWTGFIAACWSNSLEVVQLLIDKYSSITEQKNNNGNTGFIIACRNNSLEVVQLLIDKYSSITEQKNNGGWTGFIAACYNNSLEVVQLLLDKYSSITEQKNNDGLTGYDYLSEVSKKTIIEYISKNNLNVRKPKI